MWANEKDMLGNVLKAPKILFKNIKYVPNQSTKILSGQNLGEFGKEVICHKTAMYFPKSHC